MAACDRAGPGILVAILAAAGLGAFRLATAHEPTALPPACTPPQTKSWSFCGFRCLLKTIAAASATPPFFQAANLPRLL